MNGHKLTREIEERVDAHEKEGEDDATKEEPLSDCERNVDTTIGLILWTRVEDGV